MRIVQALGWYFPESIGGTEVYVQTLSEQLQVLGHEVVIAAPEAGASREREYEYDGLRVYRYPISRCPSRSECQGLRHTRGSEYFHAWIRRQRPDIVHFHTMRTGMGPQEVEVASSTGAAIIVTSHTSSLGYVCQRGTMMRWGTYVCDGVCRPTKCASCALQGRGMSRVLATAIGSIPPWLGRCARHCPGRFATALGMSDFIERNLQKQRHITSIADRLVTLTAYGQRVLEANGVPPGKLVLNRLGHGQSVVVKKPAPEIAPTRRPIKVGYLGRFDAVKGVRELARAVSVLPDGLLTCEFRGPVRTRDEEALIEELKTLLHDRRDVTFAPAAHPSAVFCVLGNYDVLCCPSICLEGGPTVAIEAHAVGTPVIGSRIGGLAELIIDGVNGALVPPGDWGALSRCLLRVAQHPESTIDSWRRLLPEGRTMEQIARDYVAIYKQSR
jgi:glycosyltransferase involved in cell wall biosynthesis